MNKNIDGRADWGKDLPSSMFAIVPDIRACGSGIVC